jgi:hypothetical protein
MEAGSRIPKAAGFANTILQAFGEEIAGDEVMNKIEMEIKDAVNQGYKAGVLLRQACLSAKLKPWYPMFTKRILILKQLKRIRKTKN